MHSLGPVALCEISGPWGRPAVAEFLAVTVIPMRIGVESPSGWPTVLSVWFVPDDDDLLAATRPTSALVRSLERQSRCGFEIAADEPPYRGVRGRGLVELDRSAGRSTLERLLTRYLGDIESPLARRLLAQADDEVCVRIRPRSIVSWDFSARMADSLEAVDRR